MDSPGETFGDLGQPAESPVVVTLPSRRVLGTVRYDPGVGVRLAFIDPSAELFVAMTNGTSKFPLLHGQLRGGPPITLFDLIVKNATLGGAGFADFSLVAHLMLVGGHLSGRAAKVFECADVYLDRLDDWFGDRTIETETEPNPELPGRFRFVARCAEGRGLGFSCLSGEPSLLIASQFDERRNSPHAISLSMYRYVRLAFREKKSLDEVLTEVYRVQTFFSLGAGRQLFVRKVGLPGGNGRRSTHPAKVGVLMGGFLREPERHRSAEAALQVGDLECELPRMWSNWCARYPNYETAVHLLTALDLHGDQFENFEFLALLQALETVHRNRFGGTFCDSDKYAAVYKALVAAIPGDCPDDLRQSLKNRVRYGNEVSLRRRLRDLQRLLDEPLQTNVAPDLTGFLVRCVDTRNYLTHYTPEGKQLAFTEDELPVVIRQVKMFLWLVLLVDLGADQAKVHARLSLRDGKSSR